MMKITDKKKQSRNIYLLHYYTLDLIDLIFLSMNINLLQKNKPFPAFMCPSRFNKLFTNLVLRSRLQSNQTK